jgi:NAD(P)-dependent dehydrogenase (short-subunit alcohol dehydrogenase family)
MRTARSGRIVLLSSIGGLLGLPFQAFYSASKFAIEGLAEAMAYEVEPFGIKVTLVEPGNVRTDFTDKRRIASGPAGGGDTADFYAKALSKAVGTMEHDERDGVQPEKVAIVVRKVLESARPPRRTSVGKASERVGLMAKRLVPFSVFQAAARSSLGV